jgi:hypothetical protein
VSHKSTNNGEREKLLSLRERAVVRQYVATATPEERKEHKESMKAHFGLISRSLGEDHADALMKAGHFAFHGPSIRAMHDMAWNLPHVGGGHAGVGRAPADQAG